MIPNNIRKVLIDFTFGLNEIGILDKCYRNYQGEDRYLLIVMMQERMDCAVEDVQKLIQDTDDISYKGNIKVLSFKGFLEFLGLSLSSNRITEVKGLNNLIHLESLSLSRNYITEIKGLNRLQSLKRLDLSWNEITQIQGLENLVNLQELKLWVIPLRNLQSRTKKAILLLERL